MPALLESPHVASHLAAASQLYLAIETRDGPLVTPELFTAAADRLWMLTARSTAKGRLVKDGAGVGALCRSPEGALVVAGTAEMFDLLEPATLLAKLGDLLAAGTSLARFLVANGYEMTGAATQAVTARLGVPPDPRSLISLRPTAVLATDDHGAILTAEGWDGPGGEPAHDGSSDRPQPEEVDVPALTSGDVALGWRAAGGPVALAGAWDPERSIVAVPAAVFDSVGAAPSSPASICADEWDGPGPLGKRGVVFRGHGWAERDGEQVMVTVDVARVVEWEGITVSGQST